MQTKHKGHYSNLQFKMWTSQRFTFVDRFSTSQIYLPSLKVKITEDFVEQHWTSFPSEQP